MLGKLSSVGSVVEELRKLEVRVLPLDISHMDSIWLVRKIHNYALTQFVQGATRRWAIGWSHGDERLPDVRPPTPNLQ